ncbi:MAG: hypothetical protein ABEJ98_05895 [Candidatus Nanohaloarchaea archaeon]
MAEEDTLIAQIPSNFYAILAVGIVAVFLVGGLTNLDIQISQAYTSEYRKAAVLENVLELDANATELRNSGLEPYNYSGRRATVPIVYFTNRLEKGSVGFTTKSVRGDTDANCYLPKIPGLDERFAYRLDIMKLQAEQAGNHDYGIPAMCEEQRADTQGELRNAVFSQILLEPPNPDKPLLPARIYIYEP